MNSMNFELAQKQLALTAAEARRRRGRPARARPVHRPSVGLILLASAIQIIAMAALLGTVATVLP